MPEEKKDDARQVEAKRGTMPLEYQYCRDGDDVVIYAQAQDKSEPTRRYRTEASRLPLEQFLEQHPELADRIEGYSPKPKPKPVRPEPADEGETHRVPLEATDMNPPSETVGPRLSEPHRTKKGKK